MRYLVFVLGLIFLGSCSGPKTINDKDMQYILQDIFWANALSETYNKGLDSLDIYQSVFQKYGYQVEDMVYTLKEQARKKSSRFSNVMERALDSLTAEYAFYQSKVDLSDTIRARAVRRFTTVVHRDSLIKVESYRDTSRLNIDLPASEGQYKISYKYSFSESSKLKSLRSLVEILDKKDSVVTKHTKWVLLKGNGDYDLALDAPEDASRIKIKLFSYTNASNFVSAELDDVLIEHSLTEQASLDSLDKQILNYKLLIDDGAYNRLSQDLRSLGVNPPRMVEERDSLDQQ